MILAMQICLILALFMSSILMAVASMYLYNKGQIESGIQIQCGSGDSEVMSISHNFWKNECDESRASKVKEAFDMVQERRDLNHAKWLKIREDAIKENESKKPEELKLRSVTEGPKELA